MTNPTVPMEMPRIELATRPLRVTFFEDRAEVVRTARAQLPAGTVTISLQGVTPLVDDQSVQPVVTGPAKLLSAQVTRRTYEAPAGSDSELRDSESDQKRAQSRRALGERSLEVAQVHEGRTAALLLTWIVALGRVPRGATTGLGSWRTALGQLLAAQEQALDRLSAAQRELADSKLDEKRAQLRYHAARRLRPRRESTLDLQVEVPAPAELTIEVTYLTPCALWRPEHLARLTTNPDGTHSLQLTTSAVVWQRCGEDWSSIQCLFSTARPAQHAAPPLLSEDQLRLRRKTDAERRTIIVEAREQSIAVAGLGRGSQKVEEMPGVDDGGEPLHFEATRPVTIQSTGHPHRIEIAQVTMPAQVERVVFPERSMAAHLRATATLVGTRPLLAGPVVLSRGSELCGRGRIQFVGRGEPFELGFGPDDGLRVRRQTSEEREQATLTGTQRIARTIKLFVSNLSGTARKLTVSERVPVSEIREVEVHVDRTSGMRWDGKDGFAHFDLDLPARATRELLLCYHIEAPSRVQLPPL